MSKKLLKKSEVLREGYNNGLKRAMKVINEMLDDFGYTAEDLFDAIHAGNTSLVEEIIVSGVDVNARNNNDWTALHVAARWGRKGICEKLLTLGAAVDATERHFGRTPLHATTEAGYTEIVELLLEYGADANAQDDSGWTPLIIAAKFGYTDICELLLQHDADIYATDKNGYTAKELATTKDNMETVNLLTSYED